MAQPWIDVREFGGATLPRADAAGEDWSPIIQDAINYIIGLPMIRLPPGMGTSSDLKSATLYFPPGFYRIKKPIFLCKRVPGDFWRQHHFAPFAIELVGEAHSLDSIFHASCIHAEFTDLPAIIIQGGQGVRLRNLVILGENLWQAGNPNREAVFPNPHYRDKDTDNSYRVSEAIRDTRHSPYAGVCIDPFHDLVTAEEQYPGLGGFYEQPGLASNDVVLEHCVVKGFTVGVCLTPCGVQLPGIRPDLVPLTMTRCLVVDHKSDLAIGHHRNRRPILQSTGMGMAKYCVNCVDYGSGMGDCPAIFGINVGGVKHIFHTSCAGGTLTVEGLYCEAVLSLGQLRGPEQGLPASYLFQGCNFGFMDAQVALDHQKDPPEPMPLPAMDAHLYNLAHTTFQGCQFVINDSDTANHPPLPLRFINAAEGSLTFEDCLFSVAPSLRMVEAPGMPMKVIPDPGAPLWVSGELEQVRYRNCRVADARLAPDRAVSPAVLSDWRGVRSFEKIPAEDRNTTFLLAQSAPGCFYFQTVGLVGMDDKYPLRWVSATPRRILLNQIRGDFPAAIWLTAKGDGTATFAAPDPDILQPGDLIESADFIDKVLLTADLAGQLDPLSNLYARVIVGKIINVVGDTVTLRYVPKAIKSGYYLLSLAYFPRIHPPTKGNVVGTENGITITEIDSLVGGRTTLKEAWAIGDRLHGEGITPGSFIKDVSDTSITMSKPSPLPAGGRRDNIRIYDADIRSIKLLKFT